MITHDLGVVAETCDAVAVFYLGEIVERGKTRDIFHHTKHPYTRQLLASLPNPNKWGQDLNVIPGSVPTNFDQIEGCSFETRCSERLEICKSTYPLNVKFGDSHQAACHLYEGGN